MTKIIDQTYEPMNKNTPEQNTPTPLNQESFAAIAGAFSRLSQLGDKKIVTGDDNRQEEAEQLLEFLAKEFLSHAGEFIACYQLVHTEYLPLANGIRRLLIRCGYNPSPVIPFNPALN